MYVPFFKILIEWFDGSISVTGRDSVHPMSNPKTLTDANDFFVEVVDPSVRDFLSSPSTFRSAFGVVTALFHAHEWVYEFKRTEVEAHFGQAFAKKGDLWGFIETQVPKAAFIRDLANASKHVRLTIKPSTTMTHIANTSIQTVGFGVGGYGQGRYGGGPTVTMKDGSADVSLDDCVNSLVAFWAGLRAVLYPSAT